MKRIALALSALAVIAGISACGSSPQQNPAQSQAYRYGEVIGGMTFLELNASVGRAAHSLSAR